MRALRQGASFISNFSFTLYVIHLPFYFLLRWLGTSLLGRDKLSPGALSDLGLYCGILLAALVFAYGFYRMFEARTSLVRRWLRNWLLEQSESVARVAPAKH